LGKRLDLIQELGELRARSLRMDRFQFRHKLFQEYLYDQLGSGEKVQMHRQVAIELERLLLEAAGGISSQDYLPETPSSDGAVMAGPEDLDAFGPLLLHHFWLGWVWPRAAGYARKLGQRARQRYAMREAIAYFEQALQALDRQAGASEVLVFDTLIDWVEAAFKFRPYQEQLERLKRAEGIARKAQDKPRLIRSLHWTANVLLERGLWTQAGPALTECLLLAEELGIEQLSVHPVYFKALMTTFSDPAEAVQWIDRAEGLAHKYQDMHIEALAFATLGQVDAQLGQFTRSHQAIESAHQVSGRLGSPLTASDVDLLAAWSYLAMGDSQRALEFGQNSVAKAIATDNMDCICSGLACIGYANLALGKIPEAAAAFEKGIERSEVSGAIIPRLNGQAGLAMTHFLSGQPEAVDDLEKVIAAMNQNQFQVGAANASQMLGACLTQLGAYERAASCLDQAVAFFRQINMQPFLAKALLSQAELLDKRGNAAEATSRRAEAKALKFT
jgi:tetratricopeptide (TPR) repeat protein